MILIISTPSDEHAAAVINVLKQRDAPHYLLDMGNFPIRDTLSIHYNSDSFLKNTWNHIHLNDCKVAWWRRPQQFQLDEALTHQAEREFAFNESFSAVNGLWAMLDCHWVNNPLLDDAASRKVYQLKIATELGLIIPKTLVTNNPDQARHFIEAIGKIGRAHV